MNYLRNNLDNSTILCYDIMFEIYQYADPMYHVFECVKNKNYDLDTIMYKRMLKHMNNILRPYGDYVLGWIDKEHYYINKNNMNDEKFKHHMIYALHGYKDVFFMDFRRIPYMICGLDSREPHYNRYKMFWDLQLVYGEDNEEINFNMSLEYLYTLWKKL
jgi:hypothetical protein